MNLMQAAKEEQAALEALIATMREMPGIKEPKAPSPTGFDCEHCGGLTIWTGSGCRTCQDCGQSNGCG